MSTSALAAMAAHKKEAIENGPASQTFTLDPDDTAISFKGIFVESMEESKEDSGNVRANFRVPLIIVDEILTGFVREAIVTDGTTRWKISKTDKDDFRGSTVWLY